MSEKQEVVCMLTGTEPANDELVRYEGPATTCADCDALIRTGDEVRPEYDEVTDSAVYLCARCDNEIDVWASVHGLCFIQSKAGRR